MNLEGWRTRPLGDFLNLITYGFTNPMPTTDAGPFMLTAKDIRGGKIDYESARHTSPEAFHSNLTDKSRPKIGDILLTKDGSIGRVAVCDRSDVCINQSVALLRPNSDILPTFLSYLLQAPVYQRRMESDSDGSTIKHIYITRVDKMPILVPDLQGQAAIVELLGALDDKIAANSKLVQTSATLTRAVFTDALRKADDGAVLSEITELLSRGVTPKYSDSEDTVVVLNQKCIRNQRVNLVPARRTLISKVREDKLLKMDDVLVNSTGQGTLGRVARWTHSDSVTVDSHITIVRFDQARVDPVCAGMALLSLQETIVEMGEGSTGQTELSRTELGKLRLTLPDRGRQAELGQRFTAMAEMEREHLRENQILAATRDALLPQLMSGKLRVRDAEKVLENAGV